MASTLVIAVLLCFCATFLLVADAQRQFHSGECCEEYCYDLDNDRPHATRFATKTPYQFVKGANRNQYFVPNCNPTKFWIFSRHGTRLPGAKTINEMRGLSDLRDQVIANYETRHSKPDRGFLCNEDLEILKHWTWNPNITGDYDNFLTTQGWDDLKYLARDYQRIYPNVIDNIYAPERFLFRHTDTQRTEASYKAFVEGLFGENAYEHIKLPPTVKDDILLKPYDMCPTWNAKKDELSADPNSELHKFERSDTFVKVLQDISRRLGFKYDLSHKQIELIWDMCRYDQSWQLDTPSPWCAAFTPYQVSVLEYAEDLKYYYQSGYGSSINSRVTCSAVADMLKHLDSKELPKVIAYFTHSSSLQLFLTALGAVRDVEALRADNFHDASMNRRKWRTSDIGPFAGNVAVIKYDCPNDNERTKAVFVLNQKPIDFDWCKVGLCDWSKVKEKFAEFGQGNCESTFCQPGSAGLAQVSISLILATIVSAILKTLV